MSFKCIATALNTKEERRQNIRPKKKKKKKERKYFHEFIALPAPVSQSFVTISSF